MRRTMNMGISSTSHDSDTDILKFRYENLSLTRMKRSDWKSVPMHLIDTSSVLCIKMFLYLMNIVVGIHDHLSHSLLSSLLTLNPSANHEPHLRITRSS